MTLNNLRYLEVLIEEKNLTRAAARLFITQPTLTAYINRLEHELGVRLFDRSRSPIELTSVGQVYIEKIRKIVLEEQKLKEQVQLMAHPQDRLIIGIGQIHSEIFAPELIRLMLKKHPEIYIKMAENKETILMDKLKTEEIDLFIGHTNIDTVNYHFEEIADERLSLFLPARVLNLSEKERRNTWKEPYIISQEILADLTMIVPDSTQGLYLNFTQLVAQYNLNTYKKIGTANTVTAITLVAMGLGYALSSTLIARRIHPELQGNLVNCILPGMISDRKCYGGFIRSNPNIELILEVLDIVKGLYDQFEEEY